MGIRDHGTDDWDGLSDLEPRQELPHVPDFGDERLGKIDQPSFTDGPDLPPAVLACSECGEFFEVAPEWEHCPKCGDDLETLERG